MMNGIRKIKEEGDFSSPIVHLEKELSSACGIAGIWEYGIVDEKSISCSRCRKTDLFREEREKDLKEYYE